MTRFFNFALLLCLGASICLATVVTNRLVENKLTPVRMEDRVCEVSKEGFPERAIEIVNILNVNSDNFLDDFAIEVRNISDKPIYSIYLAGLFPNSGKIINQSAGFAMFYGDPSLIDRSKQARPEDKPINPGDTAQIKIFKKIAEGYKESLRIGKHPISVFSKIVVRFQTLNFGDGTGYSLSDYVDKTKKINLYKPSSISSPVRSFLVSNSTSNSGKGATCSTWKIQNTGWCCGQVNGCTYPVAAYSSREISQQKSGRTIRLHKHRRNFLS